ncbi:hypothetical protein [Streptomyces sp. NPDC018833]|uniref:hypothetical protein n=1 Tax=Streptomyces sp. NPDC018833 TaxID=3365053 RepID=UPI00379C99FD
MGDPPAAEKGQPGRPTLAMAGRPDEAAEALVRITADARRILEPGHRHLRVAERSLGELGGR